jgi:hypothetical protein
VNVSTKAALDGAIAKANATICAQQPNCRGYGLPCPGSPITVPACIDGVCDGTIAAAAWAEAAFQEQPKTGVFSTPASCRADGCTLWTVTPDAKVVIRTVHDSRTATLSNADFGYIDDALRGIPFRTFDFPQMLGCGASPAAGDDYSLNLTRGTATTGIDVSGCVLAGAADNPVQHMFKLLQAY